MLSLAQRDAQDGKAGVAYKSVCQAIEGFESVTSSFVCTQKLIGDLYSLGASLPPSVFGSSADVDILNQIAFVAKGESFYKAASAFYLSCDDREANLLQASSLTDAGANILLQGQLTTFYECKGLSVSNKSQALSTLYQRAAIEFRRAIERCPEYAPAWCGLGCSMVFSDPLLAQHCFCRSLELDSLYPDAYSNLAFLYTSREAFNSSNEVLDALTQVADSPMMWINRALILERNAATDILEGEGGKAKERISQAADAYRAAIQVVKHPSAMLGLALTCRASSSGTPGTLATGKGPAAFQDSYGYLLQYKGKMGNYDISANLLEDVARLEIGANTFSDGNCQVEEPIASLQEDLTTMKKLRQELQEGCDNNGLDLNVFMDCLSSDTSASEEVNDETTSEAKPIDMTIARQIVHEPHRGDLWVDFAKMLLRENGGSKDGIKNAQVAASRAVLILTHELSFPNQQKQQEGKFTKIVDSKDLSDALALKHWLDSLAGTHANPDKDMDDAATVSPCTTLELQKALMMNPNNKFAREVLTIAVGKD